MIYYFQLNIISIFNNFSGFRFLEAISRRKLSPFMTLGFFSLLVFEVIWRSTWLRQVFLSLLNWLEERYGIG